MSEIEILIELLDEKTLNYILSEIFSDNKPKLDIKLKKIKLQKLLREPNINKVKARYKNNGNTCLYIVKRLMADEELLNISLEEFMSLIVSEEKSGLTDVAKFCTAAIKYPDIVQNNIDVIIRNHRNKEFLFKDIKEFNISDTTLNSIILINLKKDMELLKEEIEKIKLESDKIKSENLKLSRENSELLNENKKILKESKKNISKIKKIQLENDDLIKENSRSKIEIRSANEELNILENKYKNIKSNNEELLVQLKENKSKSTIDFRNNLENLNYEICIIHTTEIPAIEMLFKDILFLNFGDYLLDNKIFIDNLNNRGIKKIYIVSTNISTRDIGIFKRKIKRLDMELKTLLSLNELELAKELLEQNSMEETYSFY